MTEVNAAIAEDIWTPVCQLQDLIDNAGICVLFNDCQVALFRTSASDLYAIDNFDPFSKANVLSRGICGDLQGQPVVASPIYKQHFNLQTGQCIEDESVSVPVYAVRVVDDAVQLAALTA